MLTKVLAVRPCNRASCSHCSFPSLDQSCWERCDESSQTAFILPPDPPPCISPITRPTGLRSNFLTLIALLASPLLSTNPHLPLSSLSVVFESMCGDMSASEHMEKLNVLEKPCQCQLLIYILQREPLLTKVDLSASCCPSLGSYTALHIWRVLCGILRRC